MKAIPKTIKPACPLDFGAAQLCGPSEFVTLFYAAASAAFIFTETRRETPGSCMVTP
jgi:hypothetical protein